MNAYKYILLAVVLGGIGLEGAEDKLNLGAHRDGHSLAADVTDLMISPDGDLRTLLIGKAGVDFAKKKGLVFLLENITWPNRQKGVAMPAKNWGELMHGRAKILGYTLFKKDKFIIVYINDSRSLNELNSIVLEPGDIVVRQENTYPGGMGAIFEDATFDVLVEK